MAVHVRMNNSTDAGASEVLEQLPKLPALSKRFGFDSCTILFFPD